MNCRHCRTPLVQTFIDLGFAPPSNAYLSESGLFRPEKYYPLKVKVCGQCWLVQTEDYVHAEELFSPEYAYFSSTSSKWLTHAARYAQKMINELGLNKDSIVVEVASNDGYLLKNFVAAGIRCLGIEPTSSTAQAAENLGISVIREFFDEALGNQLSAQGYRADLIVGNNVYAHIPDINSFTRGLKAALKPNGTITLEFPHLMRLIEHTQFDTVYHEHFSYLALFTVNSIFAAAGLRLWKVEELSTHGGSLRVYGCHVNDPRNTEDSVPDLLLEEREQGLQKIETYLGFQNRAEKLKDDLLQFLIEQKRAGKKVGAYGAAAKGNTLLNYAGIKPDLISFVCDLAEAKQGKYMPGSHIPIVSPDAIQKQKPDFMLILPWNIAEEIRQQLADLAPIGVRFVTAVPNLREI